jgi:hypothetical protein
MKRTFHIWVKNDKTNEVKCKLVQAHSFSSAASDAYFFQAYVREKTEHDWNIMAINDTKFSYDPKTPIL